MLFKLLTIEHKQFKETLFTSNNAKYVAII